MLRLVATQASDSNVVSFDEAEDIHAQQRALRAEAQAIEAWRGKNPYTDFLRKFGRRPSCEEASTIGFLMDARVKASDGSMQPLPSKAQKTQASVERKRQINERNKSAQAFRLKKAILALAANHRYDSVLTIDSIGREFWEDKMKNQLDHALLCLNRIIEEFRRREEGKPERNP